MFKRKVFFLTWSSSYTILNQASRATLAVVTSCNTKGKLQNVVLESFTSCISCLYIKKLTTFILFLQELLITLFVSLCFFICIISYCDIFIMQTTYNLLRIYPLLWESFLIDYKSICLQHDVITQKSFRFWTWAYLQKSSSPTIPRTSPPCLPTFPPLPHAGKRAVLWSYPCCMWPNKRYSQPQKKKKIKFSKTSMPKSHWNLLPFLQDCFLLSRPESGLPKGKKKCE